MNIKPLKFLPALIIMCLIFYFSAQPSDTSSEVSNTLTVQFVSVWGQLTHKNWLEEQILAHAEVLEHYVRKLAHMTEYFILAVSIAFPLYSHKIRGWRMVLFTSLFCAAFAGSDELHQAFVPGRYPSVSDVGIDSLGAFLGAAAAYLFLYLKAASVHPPQENAACFPQRNRK